MPLFRAVARKYPKNYHFSEAPAQPTNRSRLSVSTRRTREQEFAEERKHVVRQHAAETQELSDIIAAVEVRARRLLTGGVIDAIRRRSSAGYGNDLA